MAKLYFRHGTVGSAKTLNLLAVAHNYRQQGKQVVLLKPDIDTRFGKERIKSRAGTPAQSDLLQGEYWRADLRSHDASGRFFGLSPRSRRARDLKAVSRKTARSCPLLFLRRLCSS